MTREQKIELIAGVSNHSVSFITTIVSGNDDQLERMFQLAKATVNQEINETYLEATS